jgi:hypothetical protein
VCRAECRGPRLHITPQWRGLIRTGDMKWMDRYQAAKFCEMSAMAKWRVSMREWLLILILVALIFYFLVFPDQSSAVLNWLWGLLFRW